MLVPSCVQAICTAVNEVAKLPAAILARITPPLDLEAPTAVTSELRSAVKTVPEPVAGGGVPLEGAGSLFLLPPQLANPQPVQTANTPMPSFDKNSSLSIFNSSPELVII